MKQYIKDNKIFSGALELDGFNIINPTEEQLLKAGYEEYIEPVQQSVELTYEQKVINLIRTKYTLDEELAIQRQRDTKPDEFKTYFDFCEECKINAKN
jgi:hypothetical protein